MTEKIDNPNHAPLYKCHKEVRALKIKEMKFSPQVGNILVPEDTAYTEFFVTDDYVAKHSPAAGGYWVLYKDGYQSYSPAEAFEEGYTLHPGILSEDAQNPTPPPGAAPAWVGLTEQQEPKYKVCTLTGTLLNRTTGVPIPSDEPLFIMRAKDVMATRAMHEYRDAVKVISPAAHVELVTRRIREFRAWQKANPGKVKNPD